MTNIQFSAEEIKLLREAVTTQSDKLDDILTALMNRKTREESWEKELEDRITALGVVFNKLNDSVAARSKPVAWVSEADMERLIADKWAVVEVSAYVTVDNGGNVPLYA